MVPSPDSPQYPGPLRSLTGNVDYLWSKAEELDSLYGTNMADRLVVLITSDVGRRPFYNSNAGKDHYPYSSAVIMAKGQPWTNKVVGCTGLKHEGIKFNQILVFLKMDPGNTFTLNMSMQRSEIS